MKQLIMMLLFGFSMIGCVNCDCPDPIIIFPEPEVVKEDVLIVYFDFDSSELTGEAKETLNSALYRDDDLEIAILAHTDSQGSEDYNMELSERRAKTVSAYLKSIGVVNGWFAYGETRLLNEDETLEEHQENRRAEVVFTIRG